jgi:hypothetical protein
MGDCGIKIDRQMVEKKPKKTVLWKEGVEMSL